MNALRFEFDQTYKDSLHANHLFRRYLWAKGRRFYSASLFLLDYGIRSMLAAGVVWMVVVSITEHRPSMRGMELLMAFALSFAIWFPMLTSRFHWWRQWKHRRETATCAIELSQTEFAFFPPSPTTEHFRTARESINDFYDNDRVAIILVTKNHYLFVPKPLPQEALSELRKLQRMEDRTC